MGYYPGRFDLSFYHDAIVGMLKLDKIHKLLDPEIRRKNIRQAGYGVRGLYWQGVRPQVPDPLFIIGCSRSGTTVTYETVSNAPGLLSFGIELPELWNGLYGPQMNGWASEAASAEDARPEHRDAILKYFYQRLGAGWVVDKTCINVMRVPYLLRLFPDAKFLFIHRDGRDNVSSLMDGWRFDHHFGLTQFLGDPPEPVAIDDGGFSEWSFFLPPGWRDYNQASLEEVCAYQWLSANRLALEGRALVPEQNWAQLRYEDIFERPVAMFEEAFERLGLAFDAPMRARCETLNQRPTSIVSGGPQLAKWRRKNPEAIARILDRIAPMQAELGYPH